MPGKDPVSFYTYSCYLYKTDQNAEYIYGQGRGLSSCQCGNSNTVPPATVVLPDHLSNRICVFVICLSKPDLSSWINHLECE